MLRQVHIRTFIKPLSYLLQTRYVSTGKPWASTASEEDLEAARKWRSTFQLTSIDKRPAIITTSRSSGPGGQHVNTTNSKVTLKYPINDLLRQIPGMLHDKIRASKYCKKGGFLLIQVSEARKQAQNENNSWVRLYEEILSAAGSIPGRTSDAQKARVKELQEKERFARMRLKKYQSSKKQSRRSGGLSYD